MALFGKKEKKEKTVTCAICGAEEKTGFFRSFVQKSVGGHFVCKSCYGKVDLPDNRVSHMSLEDFHAYRAFREENQKLKEGFKLTGQFSLDSDNLYFDVEKRLMCLNKDLSTTIFEGAQIKSFEIHEDSLLLIEGSEKGLVHHESNVQDQVMAMIPEIRLHQTQMILYQDRLNKAPEDKKEEIRAKKPLFDRRVPFEKFNISIQLDHPYWSSLSLYLYAPKFDRDYPDVNDYLSTYNQRVGVVDKLAKTLMTVAFPGAKDLSGSAAPAVPSPAVEDPVAELKRYKELLDMGIINQDEFAAKKKQLLGL